MDVFRKALALHGAPTSVLCDNGAVFTATPRGGEVLLQIELEQLGIAAKNSRPYHPQTRGKVELLIADREIRVLDLDTGQLIRRLTLDPSRDYQPIGGG